MTRNGNTILDLGPVEQFDFQDNGLILYNGDKLTFDELEKIARTAKTQGAGLYAIQEKTKRAMATIGEITVSGVKVFDETFGKLMEIRDRHKAGTERYRVVAGFIDQVVQEFGIATMQAMRIGEKWVLQVLYTSPFPIPEDKPKRSKLTRFGRFLLTNNDDI